MKWVCSSLLCYNNFCTKADTDDRIKYCRLLNNTETQQEYQTTLKTTRINCDKDHIFSETWLKGFVITVSICQMSLLLISDFKNGKKNVKTFFEK